MHQFIDAAAINCSIPGSTGLCQFIGTLAGINSGNPDFSGMHQFIGAGGDLAYRQAVESPHSINVLLC